jgi:hypothetical protein
MLYNPSICKLSAKLGGENRVSSSDPGGRVGFQAGEQQPPLTSLIGQDLRNWLWKRRGKNSTEEEQICIPIVRLRKAEKN